MVFQDFDKVEKNSFNRNGKHLFDSFKEKANSRNVTEHYRHRVALTTVLDSCINVSHSKLLPLLKQKIAILLVFIEQPKIIGKALRT